MEEVSKSGNLFGSLIQHISDPFLVLDLRGKILSFNELASEILMFEDQKGDIFTYLDEPSAAELGLVFSKKLPSRIPISVSVSFALHSGATLDATLLLNSYMEKDEEFILCRIKRNKNFISVNEKTMIKVRTDDFAEIIHNKKIRSILDEIKSLYPFTFIGKERIQKFINELDEFFWIQDMEGNYQLLNDKLANSLGISIIKVEGKPVGSFLPVHLVDFQNSLISYIKQSLNCIIIEGIPIKNMGPVGDYQTIEIPLSDVDNKVMAIVGITQRISGSGQDITVSDVLNSTTDLLQFIQKPVALIDKNGIIRQATEEFCKLFEQESNDLRESHYKSVLPGDIVGKIDQFIISSSDKKKYEFYNQNKFKKKYSEEITLQLNKIYNGKFDYEGFSLLVEIGEESFDLTKLFLRKGKMYELLIDNNPEPIFIYDTENLRFLEVNKAALDLYGYRKDEFLQLDLTDLYTTEDIQSLLDTSKNELAEEKFSGPYKHKRKDGSSVFVELSKGSFKFEDKNANFIVVRNVSEKLELQKKNKSFDAVFDNSDSLIFITDTGGFISFVNDTACRILGHSKDDFKDTSFATYLIDEDRGNVNANIFKEQSIDVITLKINMKNGEGGSFEAEVMAVPVLNYKNEIESFTLIIKRNAEPIVETKEVVKEVIVEKPVETYPANISPGKMEPSFLSNLFHEILTPINVILGFVQDFTDSITNLTPEQKESSEIINQNRDRLLKTMNAVVDYTNLQKDKIDFEISDVPITEIIDTLQNNIKEITRPKEIEFAYGRISSSLIFKTDRERFQNLLNTLVKFASGITRENKIYFSAYPESNDRFIISIKDNYTHPTKKLLDFYKDVFIHKLLDSKEYGISTLQLRLAEAMLKALNGKAEVTGREGNEELSFVFPLEFKETEKSELISEEKPADEIERAIEELKDETVIEEPVIENEYPTIEDEPVDLIPDSDEFEFGEAESNAEQEPEEFEQELEAKEFLLGTESVTLDEAEIGSEIKNDVIQEELGPNMPRETLKKVNLSALRCLYIEDQVDSQILFKVQMKELKEIKFAVSFEEAMSILDSDSFDFIVIDINLQGDYNGLDALKLIQKMPGYENIPIIAVTAYVLPGDKEKFIATGFSEFISKPIFKEKMVDVLAKIFSGKI